MSLCIYLCVLSHRTALLLNIYPTCCHLDCNLSSCFRYIWTRPARAAQVGADRIGADRDRERGRDREWGRHRDRDRSRCDPVALTNMPSRTDGLLGFRVSGFSAPLPHPGCTGRRSRLCIWCPNASVADDRAYAGSQQIFIATWPRGCAHCQRAVGGGYWTAKTATVLECRPLFRPSRPTDGCRVRLTSTSVCQVHVCGTRRSAGHIHACMHM